jgi:hypothetical protein
MLKERRINISYERLKEAYVKYSLRKLSEEEFNKFVPKEVEKAFLNSITPDKEMTVSYSVR